MPLYDAIVIGSGPNGLCAAIELAKAGLSVAVYEGKECVGGGMRTAEWTLPGFHHDTCSAIHPLGVSSPVLQSYDLKEFGLNWVQPDLPLAHPFDNGTAAVLAQDLKETGNSLGTDAEAWNNIFSPLSENWSNLVQDVLAPLHLPRHPILLTRFALNGFRSAETMCRHRFKGYSARALFTGMAAHVMLPLHLLPTAAFGLMLGAAGHAVGWPLPYGGARSIATALAGKLQSLGSKIFVNQTVKNVDELPSSNALFFDLTPWQLVRIAGHKLPESYVKRLKRFHYGNGIFKMDWALSEPVPWKNEACKRAGTVHLGGQMEGIVGAEKEAADGKYSKRPFVLVAQQSLFDPSRAPSGKHTLWAYCHCNKNDTRDMTREVENQIERFAPGFKDIILARHTMNSVQMERYNPNYIGGDINGGKQDLTQLFARPVISLNPYKLPAPGMFLCSSSTPPGGGIHGLGGYYASRSYLRQR